MKHRCKAMERDEQIRTPLGQTAWNFYRLWLSIQRRSSPTIETFLSSKYYTTFIKFTVRAKELGIPNVELFIKYMVRQEMHPAIWTNDKIYGNWLQYLDRGRDPLKQAEYTIDNLFNVADALDCNVDELFDHLEPTDLISLLQRRQLSPWILIHSNKFKQFYLDKPTKEQQLVINTIIKPKVWAKKLKSHPEVVKQMKDIVHELNL